MSQIERKYTEAETTAGGHGGAGEAAHPVRGSAVAGSGLRVVVDEPELRRGRTETLRFRVIDDRGDTVRDFDVEHEKRMESLSRRGLERVREPVLTSAAGHGRCATAA